MTGFGFPGRFIQWILCCLGSVHYSILVNGVPHGYFKGRRGLRQGDPVSPYLFVIGMEYLTRLFNQASTFPMFRFHAHCKEMELNHLVFADDLIGCCREDVESPLWVKKQLDTFLATSGLCAN